MDRRRFVKSAGLAGASFSLNLGIGESESADIAEFLKAKTEDSMLSPFRLMGLHCP